MQWQFNIYTIVLLVAAVLCGSVAVAAWRRRPLVGASALALFLGAAAEWSFAAAMEAAAVDPSTKILWSQIEYLGMCASAVFFFLFARAYAKQEGKWSLRTTLLISVLPLVTMVLVATNEWHGLVWNSFTPTIMSGLHVLIYGHGPWFWINAVYLYTLIAAAALTLIWAVGHYPQDYRMQAGVAVVAAVLPMTSGILYMTGLNPWPGLDLTPLGIVLGGPILALDLFRFRLFDLIPVARHVLFETMSDGLVVLDGQQRVADVNPAARRLMALSGMSLTGAQAGSLPAPWPAVVREQRRDVETHSEVILDEAGGRCVDVCLTPLNDQNARLTGHLMVIRDISEYKNVENELRASRKELESQLDANKALQTLLHEQAIRDSLTGLFNRRYLAETLVRELARAIREQRSLSVLMFDLDRFKQINDEFGHAAGDAMLSEVGRALACQTRLGDVACRYGGDEFIIVLPGSDVDNARRRAEGLLAAIAALRVPYADHVLTTKASCGIGAFPEQSSSDVELLRFTDRALYAAKAGGGNCVFVLGRS